MHVSSRGGAEAQTQRPRIGMLCMQFADYETNEDARGGVGYDAIGNRIEHKYRFKDYWNIDFDSLGTITNADSVSHAPLVEDAGTMSFWGSLKQWCDEIIPSCDDTTLSLGFELPPQYWPEQKTFLEVDVQGGAIDLPTRRLSMIVNILSEDTEQVPKLPANGASRRNRVESVTYVHPQPSSGRIRIGYRGFLDGPAMVYVYDALGRMALRTVIESSGTDESSVIVDLARFPDGIYYYIAQCGSNRLGAGRISLTK
mgnify:CR=1 FL=1